MLNFVFLCEVSYAKSCPFNALGGIPLKLQCRFLKGISVTEDSEPEGKIVHKYPFLMRSAPDSSFNHPSPLHSQIFNTYHHPDLTFISYILFHNLFVDTAHFWACTAAYFV